MEFYGSQRSIEKVSMQAGFSSVHHAGTGFGHRIDMKSRIVVCRLEGLNPLWSIAYETGLAPGLAHGILNRDSAMLRGNMTEKSSIQVLLISMASLSWGICQGD